MQPQFELHDALGHRFQRRSGQAGIDQADRFQPGLFCNAEQYRKLLARVPGRHGKQCFAVAFLPGCRQCTELGIGDFREGRSSRHRPRQRDIAQLRPVPALGIDRRQSHALRGRMPGFGLPAIEHRVARLLRQQLSAAGDDQPCIVDFNRQCHDKSSNLHVTNEVSIQVGFTVQHQPFLLELQAVQEEHDADADQQRDQRGIECGSQARGDP